MAHFLFSAFADEASASVKEQIAACKKNGIDYIELRNCDGKNISDFTVDEAKELKKVLDEGGIRVSSIGSHYGKIEITDDFGPHFEAFKNTVEVAKILEAKYIRIFSFYFLNGESFDEYRDEVFHAWPPWLITQKKKAYSAATKTREAFTEIFPQDALK